jgi:hypothetical protein
MPPLAEFHAALLALCRKLDMLRLSPGPAEIGVISRSATRTEVGGQAERRDLVIAIGGVLGLNSARAAARIRVLRWGE